MVIVRSILATKTKRIYLFYSSLCCAVLKIVLTAHTSHNNRTPARAGGKHEVTVPSLVTSGR